MSAVQSLNAGADVIGQRHALSTNVAAAKALAAIVKTNLGPRGTLKMLVSGAGAIKLSKDGKVLLDEMPIQHPTALLIARSATAQDDVTGDGTTSVVLFTGELLKHAERHLQESSMHPRVLVEGIEKARDHTLDLLERFRQRVDLKDGVVPRDTLLQVACTALRTKIYAQVADHLANIVVNAITAVYKKDDHIDLHMVEIMHMQHGTEMDTKFINGLVLDHGARHPNSPKRLENVFILSCNVSLEYEKSTVNSGFYYKSAAERESLVKAERKFTDDKVQQIIDFKKTVCAGSNKSFIVINQKGIDPISLEMLHNAGIVGIRRAKKRNMERFALACGGFTVNSLDDLSADCLGYADTVYEHVLGEDKFTFIEGVKNGKSCTILINGSTDFIIKQQKDAIQDGLRACLNVIEDKALVPGAGAFELSAHHKLMEFKRQVPGRAKLGVQAFADALLVIPKTLSENAGLDVTDTVIALLDEVQNGPVGVDLETGKPCLPHKLGIWDNYSVKKQFIHLGSMIAVKLLLVDEVMRAGRKMGGKGDE